MLSQCEPAIAQWIYVWFRKNMISCLIINILLLYTFIYFYLLVQVRQNNVMFSLVSCLSECMPNINCASCFSLIPAGLSCLDGVNSLLQSLWSCISSQSLWDTNMEQLRSESPQLESIRSEVSEGQDEGSSGTSTRRKRRKREHRPESIIVYRSDPERAAGEDHGGDSEGGERNSEEGVTFLNNPSSEGEACNLVRKVFGHISHLTRSFHYKTKYQNQLSSQKISLFGSKFKINKQYTLPGQKIKKFAIWI